MIELKPEDIHISLYNTERKGSWDTSHYEIGVTVIHLPTGTKVSVDRHKSQHKNRNEAMTILRDLLTPLVVGDTVWTGREFALLNSTKKGFNSCTVLCECGEVLHLSLSKISHTQKGYIYKKLKSLKEHLSILEEGYYNDRDIIMEQIKELEEL